MLKTQSDISDISTEKESVRRDLNHSILKRKVSLTEAESFFLHALLIDEPTDDEQCIDHMRKATRVLDDDMLFSFPVSQKQVAEVSKEEEQAPRRSLPKRPKRPSIQGLWEAHAQGVAPKTLVRKGSLTLLSQSHASGLEPLPEKARVQVSFHSSASDLGGDDVDSEEEVRRNGEDDRSEGSSWGEDDHVDHFDTWAVLKDEYAQDFGFDFTTRAVSVDAIVNNENVPNSFKILGTSADDKSAQPHVLSPPLMDALMNFLPDRLVGQNYWLKFSLIRDGASLDTLKQYVRAATFTIIAIETPEGEVFGSFTSSPWRHNLGFFGSSPAFVWKMRHSRQTKCYSLFDQAQLESEIDVFMATGTGNLQVCKPDLLAVGESDDRQGDGDAEDDERTLDSARRRGFAIALESDLLMGTTSPSTSFKNPALCGEGSHSLTFEVAGLEVWTFTPCFELETAERLEMTRFFVEESIHYSMRMPTPSPSVRSIESSTRTFSSRDLERDKFYRRVGQDAEGDERRSRWERTNLMNAAGPRGFGASPRFP